MAGVTFEHVSKRFGDNLVVDDLNIAIADKAFLVLVGPSGCGKTTILRMVAGLDSISEGTIRIGGRIVNDLLPSERDIAMVFETDALYPHFTVDGNLSFGLEVRKTPEETVFSKVRDVASTLHLPNLLNRKPATLSAGQRQQVAVGRAMVHEPAVFLMDEPLSKLDAKLRVSARAEISKLHQRLGTTFIYVTHDQVEAMSLGDRIAVLDKGGLQQINTPRLLYERPANVFVAGFFGNPSMNLLNARLTSEGDTLYIEAGELRLAIPTGQYLKGYDDYVDRELIFGFRPEHVHAPGFAPEGILIESCQARVEAVELLGPELLLHLNASGVDFIARVDTRMDVHVGQTTDLLLDMSAIHLFDNETEMAIR